MSFSHALSSKRMSYTVFVVLILLCDRSFFFSFFFKKSSLLDKKQAETSLSAKEVLNTIF